MTNADPLLPRPALNASGLTGVLDRLRSESASQAEIWQRLTERYVVDLDDVAALLPSSAPEPRWLARRGSHAAL